MQTAIDITVQSCTTLADTPFMFWWFKRGNEFVRYESRQVKPGAFELRFVDTDGSERVETFNNERVLEERQREVEKSLTGDGWTGPHGWNL
ncbi:MAG TPA: hypothetical protein VKE51_05955 [Vicinamibacterales bacterium]|nr:hypothetical protein [Vicinamibacterales bacterium]